MADRYKGSDFVIEYDAGVCSHAGECVRGLPKVFLPGATPWVQPGDVSFEEAAAVIAKCPSGALRIIAK